MRRLRTDRRLSSGSSGFTLIEVMIGLMIFAFGIMAVYGMQLQSIQMNNYARRLTEASSGARQKMEELKALANTVKREDPGDSTRITYNGYDDALIDANGDGRVGLDTAVAGQADGQEGNLFWNVAYDTPMAGTKTVHVIATWSWRGEVRRVTYRTAIVREEGP